MSDVACARTCWTCSVVRTERAPSGVSVVALSCCVFMILVPALFLQIPRDSCRLETGGGAGSDRPVPLSIRRGYSYRVLLQPAQASTARVIALPIALAPRWGACAVCPLDCVAWS